MMKTLATLAALAFTISAHGELRDPQNLLPQLRAFGGVRTFEDAYRCGDIARANLFRLSCVYTLNQGVTRGDCIDSPDPVNGTPVQRSIYNCSADSVSVLLDVTGDSADILRSDFESAHSSAAETFLANAAAFAGYPVNLVTLTKIDSASYTLDADSGHPRTVPALNVSGELGEFPYIVPILITVVQDVPGIVEVTRFRTDVKTWFKMASFQRSAR